MRACGGWGDAEIGRWKDERLNRSGERVCLSRRSGAKYIR